MSFLFFDCSWIVQIKESIKYTKLFLTIKKNTTGYSGAEIDSLICTIQKQSKNANFIIRFCSFDGDSHYSHFFGS